VVNVDAFDKSNPLAWEASPTTHSVISSGFPHEWLEEYFNGSYYRYDKVVHLLMKGCFAHTWEELYAQCETASERMVFDGAKTHGLYGGLSVGYSNEESRYRSFISCVGCGEGDDTRLLPIVQYLMGRIHGALVDAAFSKMRMHDELQNGPQVPVTSRAKEIAFWVCEGKTYQEIAVILGVKERTVRYHIGKLFETFGVHNRSQLVKEVLARSWFSSNKS
jgi:LuxR family quorum-sensing system transcriptional regulator ExpR